MSIEQEHSKNMTADECDELADALVEASAALLARTKKARDTEAGGWLSQSRQNEAFGIAQCELTELRRASP
jgi:hypothetical protein